MTRTSPGGSWLCAVGLLLCLAPHAGAQDGGARAATRGGGAAALASARETARPQLRDAAATAPQPVTLDVRDVPLREALRAVAAQSGVSLVYDSRTVPLERRVTVRLTGVSADDALRALLRGTDVEVREAAPGQILLVGRGRRGGAAAPAATGTLAGRVTDSSTGSAVVHALVALDAGTRRSTTTDEAGRFRMVLVPAGRWAVTVRRIGYAPATRSVVVPDGGEATLDVALLPMASRLDEVVTTVTGPQRRLEVGNAIGRIDADSVVREAPVTSLTDVIGGRVPGAQVVLNSGLTGSSPRIRVRGLNSLSLSNDPLLVIDGQRVDNGTGTSAGYGQSSGRLNDVNPNDIESIEIVKGPAAATLYGTDAANGVIVVRTKRGHPGRATWDAFAEAGVVQQPARFADNYYGWGHSTQTGAAQQCVLVQVAAGACVVDSLTTFNPLASAATSPIGTGRRQQYGLQLSGGISRFLYFLAGAYEDETGYLRMPAIDEARVSAERGGAALPAEQRRPNGLRKVSLRANGSASLGDDADVTLSTGLVSSDVRLPGNSVFTSGFFGLGFRDQNDGWAGAFGRPGENFAVRNAEQATHYTTSLAANWRPAPWLSTRATVGTDFSSTFLDALQRRGEGPLGTNRNGRRQNTRTAVTLYSADLGASALWRPSERLSSRTSVGLQYNRRDQGVTATTGTNLSPGSQTVGGAAVVSGSEQNFQSVVAGSYLEQGFGLDERLFLTGAVRADGGSSFGRDFRTALYPKASVSWVAVQGDRRPVTSARLRLAYGVSGVQPGSTAALALDTLFGALLDGSPTTGAALRAIGNARLRPERQGELEGGADVELLSGRVRAEATWYDRLSRDALIDRPLATEVGIATRQENIGSVRNRGFEGLLSLQLLQRPRLAWYVSLSGSTNRNRLEKIGRGIPFIGGNATSRSVEGYPLFSRFARPILGFADANGNGIIEESEVRVGDSLVYAGQSLPTRQATLGTTVSLFGSRLRVSAQFDYRGGFTQINFSEINRCSSSRYNCRAANDPATPLADQARAVARASTRYGNTFDGYIEDASFTRWRELALTYDVPAPVASRLRARAASLTLAGRNLRLFTRYSGVDPEVNSSPGTPGVEGYSDNPTAPQARYWTLRLNLGL